MDGSLVVLPSIFAFLNWEGCVRLRQPYRAKINAFYKQHFYKQREVEIGKKNKQMLSNTLTLDIIYLKIIYILHLIIQK